MSLNQRQGACIADFICKKKSAEYSWICRKKSKNGAPRGQIKFKTPKIRNLVRNGDIENRNGKK